MSYRATWSEPLELGFARLDDGGKTTEEKLDEVDLDKVRLDSEQKARDFWKLTPEEARKMGFR